MRISLPKQAVIVGTIFFLLYSLSASATPTGVADADELTLTSFFLSVPHPPGFPLFTVIGHLGINAFATFTNPAHAANLTSALYQAITLAFLFLIHQQFISFFSRHHQITHPSLVASAVTILTGCSYFIWQYATIFEITSFTAMLATITLYCALRWYFSPQNTSVVYYLTWIAVGLLLTHYQLSVVYLPAFLILLLTKKRFSPKPFILGIVLLIVAATATSLLLLLLNQHTAFTWNFPQTLSGVWHHLTRQDYTGLDVESNTVYRTAFALPDIFNPTALRSIFLFFSILISHLNVVVFILAILGAYFLYRHYRSIFWFTFLLFLLSGPFLAAYMHIAGYTFETSLLLGIAKRQFILAEIAIALFLIPGIFFLFNFRPWLKPVIVPGVILLCLYQILHNDSLLLNHQDRQLNYTYLKHNLEAVAPNALIICSTDIDCYGLWYQSLIERIRPDVTVLAHVPVYRRQFLSSNDTIYPFNQSENPQYLEFLIANNISTRPIYFTSGIGFYDKYLGLEDGPFFLTPQANMFQLQSQYPQSLTYQPLSPDVTTLATNEDKRNMYVQGIIQAIANNQAYAGYLMLKYHTTDIANQYLDVAQTLDPTNQQTQELIHNQAAVIKAVAIDDPHMTTQSLIKQAKAAAANQQLDRAEQAFRYAILIGAHDPHILTAASDFYTQIGDANTAAYLHQLLIYNNHVPE